MLFISILTALPPLISRYIINEVIVGKQEDGYLNGRAPKDKGVRFLIKKE